MGQDGQQIRRDKLIIDTDPGIGASPPDFLLRCVRPLPSTIVSFSLKLLLVLCFLSWLLQEKEKLRFFFL